MNGDSDLMLDHDTPNEAASAAVAPVESGEVEAEAAPQALPRLASGASRRVPLAQIDLEDRRFRFRAELRLTGLKGSLAADSRCRWCCVR